MTTLCNDCDDQVLFSKAIEGDRYAFDKLVSKHKPRLEAAAYRVTRDHEQASDAVTDALLRMFRTGETFRFDSKFSTWIHRVVVNCARDIVRKTLSRPTRSLDQLLETTTEPVLHPIEVLDDDCNRDAVLRLAQKRIVEELTFLPEPERSLLIAVHLNHEPYELIAHDLHIPVGTVKSRMFRARRMLKDRLPTLEEIQEQREEAFYAALVA